MGEAGVQVDHISKTFNPGTVQAKQALKDVHFRLQPGDFAVVIGSNGAGKSTMLNALAGEVAVDSGRIAVDGAEIHGWSVHKRARLIARVFQDPMLGTAAPLTIQENLAIAVRRGERRSLRPSVRRAELDVFRDRLSVLGLNLERRLDDKVALLSGGQRQSLTLVMATLKEPQLLLLDEHTAALDPRAAQNVMKATVETVGSHAITTVMITHNMEHAVSYGNRLLMMHEGQVILDVDGEEKANLSIQELIERFHVVNDRLLLG